MPITIMKRLRYNNIEVTDKKPRYGYNIEVLMMQMYIDNLMVKRKFVSHMPRSYNKSHAKIN